VYVLKNLWLVNWNLFALGLDIKIKSGLWC